MPALAQQELKTQFDAYVEVRGPFTASVAISEFTGDIAESARWKRFAGNDRSSSFWIVYDRCVPSAHPQEGPVETFLVPAAIARVSHSGHLSIFRLSEVKRPNQTPEPTTTLVTPRAGARVAPSVVVAHL